MEHFENILIPKMVGGATELNANREYDRDWLHDFTETAELVFFNSMDYDREGRHANDIVATANAIRNYHRHLVEQGIGNRSIEDRNILSRFNSTGMELNKLVLMVELRKCTKTV